MSLFAKVAFITGGGQGTGKAIACSFLKAGYSIAIANLENLPLEERRLE